MENSLYNMRPHLVSEWSDKNLPITPKDIPYGSNKIMWWKGKCGHEWQTSVKARSHGENCPICSGARVIEGINDLATKYPDIAAEWSHKNLPLKPTMVSAGSHKKVIWVDRHGHEWTASVKSRVQGSGCPYCSHNLVLSGFNDLASRFPEIAAEWSERNLPLTPDKVTAFKEGIETALLVFDSRPVINSELLDTIDANVEGTDTEILTYELGEGSISISCKTSEITDPANIVANFVEQDHFRNITYTGFAKDSGEGEAAEYSFSIEFDIPEKPAEEEAEEEVAE